MKNLELFETLEEKKIIKWNDFFNWKLLNYKNKTKKLIFCIFVYFFKTDVYRSLAGRKRVPDLLSGSQLMSTILIALIYNTILLYTSIHQNMETKNA
jgi:hypothetical protein